MKSYCFRRIVFLFTISVLVITLTGCTVILQRGRRSDFEKIEELTAEVDKLNAAKELLTQRLLQEIQDKKVSLRMTEKGLVINFVADVLYDSGRAKIKPGAMSALDKVARVLNENLAGFSIGIEGHTDNQPIKYSQWKSNWELSTARALGVLHYLVDDKGISGGRVSVIGYGEYKPVASNNTKGGRQLNRRVEIVVLPKMEKVRKRGTTPAVKTKTAPVVKTHPAVKKTTPAVKKESLPKESLKEPTTKESTLK